ncbi:hypothetical protein B0O99DRAFT_633404 [Bisporella sp. PMI_857]|nr:hypothetical protein B0O99DRAFT_633404 [Bisporella sp. PMI_857]
MASLPFHTLNLPSGTSAPTPDTTTFTLSPPSPTDIWRTPLPAPVDNLNAPVIYKAIPLKSFKRLRITVEAKWRTLYDQGGLVFILPDSLSPTADAAQKRGWRWIKSGIEYYKNEAYVSTVAADRTADWSLIKNPSEGGEATVEFERDPENRTLWVYAVADAGAEGEQRTPVREVTWVFGEDGEREAWVGVYAAKPTANEDGSELAVGFKGWELDLV